MPGRGGRGCRGAAARGGRGFVAEFVVFVCPVAENRRLESNNLGGFDCPGAEMPLKRRKKPRPPKCFALRKSLK